MREEKGVQIPQVQIVNVYECVKDILLDLK